MYIFQILGKLFLRKSKNIHTLILSLANCLNPSLTQASVQNFGCSFLRPAILSDTDKFLTVRIHNMLCYQGNKRSCDK